MVCKMAFLALMCLTTTAMAGRVAFPGKLDVEDDSNDDSNGNSNGTLMMEVNSSDELILRQTDVDTWKYTWHQCKDAACCKGSIAKDTADEKLCDDFYDQKVGVAFTMVLGQKWKWLQDRAQGALRFKDPIKQRSSLSWDQQSVSISHTGKAASPYKGAGEWGLLFKVGKDSNFWQYFEECHGGVLAAQCHDGFKCAKGGRTPIIGASTPWTYEKFLQAKNAVVDQTGTNKCSLANVWSYNEFSTNGLSPSALAGVIIPESMLKMHKPKPAVSDVCNVFRMANSKKHVPVYRYTYGRRRYSSFSSLQLHHYLEC